LKYRGGERVVVLIPREVWVPVDFEPSAFEACAAYDARCRMQDDKLLKEINLFGSFRKG
jgi:hypothetical protein